MNHYNDIMSYILTLGIAALIPGPGMLGLLFKTLSFHYKDALFMLLGLITGDCIFLAISLSGLHYVSLFMDSKFSDLLITFACLYLFYLSYQLWHTPYFSIALAPQSNQSNSIRDKYSSPFSSYGSDYVHGLLLTLSNPKTITFYLALVPSIFGIHLELDQSFLVIIFLTTVITLLVVGSFYIFSAYKMKMLLDHPKFQKMAMRIIAMIIFTVATSLLLRQLNS